MCITAVCFIFLFKVRWPKNKSLLKILLSTIITIKDYSKTTLNITKYSAFCHVLIYETVPWKTWEMAFPSGGGGGGGSMPPGPSGALSFGAPRTFSTLRNPRKMHAAALICGVLAI